MILQAPSGNLATLQGAHPHVPRALIIGLSAASGVAIALSVWTSCALALEHHPDALRALAALAAALQV